MKETKEKIKEVGKMKETKQERKRKKQQQKKEEKNRKKKVQTRHGTRQ